MTTFRSHDTVHGNMRFDPMGLGEEKARRLLAEFYKAVSLLETYQDVEEFFDDLLHPKETAMLSRRLQAARMLLEGYDYRTIANELKMGLTTIAKIGNWLTRGGKGYRLAIKRIIELERERQKRIEREGPGSLKAHMRQYSAYYWPELALEEAAKAIKKRKKKEEKRKSIPDEAV